MTTQAATTTHRRRRLASRLYDWLDARRWYWSLGDPVVPTLRDWPVARTGPRPTRR
jgi:hypothetical protein